MGKGQKTDFSKNVNLSNGANMCHPQAKGQVKPTGTGHFLTEQASHFEDGNQIWY